jgi:PST family polysaccharide transporter
MLKKIFESTFIMAVSSILVMALDLVRVKMMAVYLGPLGVGTLSLLNHFHSVALSVIGLGLGTGIVKYVAVYSQENNIEALETVLSNAFRIVFLLAVFSAIFFTIFSSYLAELILQASNYNIFIIIYAFSLPIAVYPMIAGSYLQGLKRVKFLALINVLRSLITLFFILPMLFFFRLRGAVFSVIVATIVHFALASIFVKKEHW